MLDRPVPVFNAADLGGEGLTTLIQAHRSVAADKRAPQPERLRSAEPVLQQRPVPVVTGGEGAC